MDERRKPVIDGAERVEGFIGDLGGLERGHRPHRPVSPSRFNQPL